MKSLGKKLEFLQDLTNLNKRDREKFLNSCSNECINVIGESVFNILKGHCKKIKSCKKNNIPQSILKKIANHKFDVAKKRKLLVGKQHGAGIFGLIASAVVPFLINLLTKKKWRQFFIPQACNRKFTQKTHVQNFNVI